MKILSAHFGSAVQFRGSLHSYLHAEKQHVDMEFAQGIVLIKDTSSLGAPPVAVFTSNVKFFVPDLTDHVAQAAAKKGKDPKIA